MARRVVRLLCRTGTAPVIAAFGISVHAASKDVPKEENERIYRACDLPLYNVSKSKSSGADSESIIEEEEKNLVQQQITVGRKAVMAFLENFRDTYEDLRSKASIGVEHSKSSLDYVQTNPGELPRVCFITVATMGGVVLGYRGGILKKLFFASIAGTSATALCYPKQTVEMSQALSMDIQEMWKDGIGNIDLSKLWPLGEKKEQEHPMNEAEGKPDVIKPTRITGDPGQSNPADKDMYSTRK